MIASGSFNSKIAFFIDMRIKSDCKSALSLQKRDVGLEENFSNSNQSQKHVNYYQNNEHIVYYLQS